MTDQPSIGTELVTSIQQVASETQQLETVLVRISQVLTQNGFQLSVDLPGVAHAINQHAENAHQQATVVTHQLGQLDELLNTFALLTSKLDLDQVLEEVMDIVIKLTGAERAYLVLPDRKTGEWRIPVARNWDRETLSESDSGFSRSIVTTALQTGEPILTTNAQSDDRFQNAKSVMNNQLRSIMCIPLVLRGDIVGVLYADNRISQDVFQVESIPLMSAFGTQAAIAIENARAFGRVKEDLNKALVEIESLKIEIDQSKVQNQVSQITESDYFQKLALEARKMRQRSGDRDHE